MSDFQSTNKEMFNVKGTGKPAKPKPNAGPRFDICQPTLCWGNTSYLTCQRADGKGDPYYQAYDSENGGWDW